MDTNVVNSRFSELDGLRGIAAMAVVIYHYTWNYNRFWGHDIVIPKIFSYGTWGVELFFIISGFVISWSILKQKNPLLFALSRFRRLYPPFWACLVVSIPIVLTLGPDELKLDFQSLLINFTMLQGFLGFKSYDGVYWTLTLELAFYLLIFIVAFFKQLEKIDYWVITWLMVTALIYLLGLSDIGLVSKLLVIKYNLFFAVGIYFYKLRSGKVEVSTHVILLLCLVLVPLYHDLKASIGCYLLFGGFWLTTQNKLRFLGARVFVFFGSISYSLYLIHQNLGYTIIHYLEAFNTPPVVSILVATICSILLASLVFYIVEKPSGKLFRNVLSTS